MLKHFACDTSEFTGVKPDLSIVDFYLEAHKLQDKLDAVEQQLQEESRLYHSSAASVMQKVLERAEQHNEQEFNDAMMEPLLARASKMIRREYRSDQEIDAILSLYLVADIEKIKADLDSYKQSTQSKAAITRLAKQREDLETKLETLWGQCEERCFDYIPHKYATAHKTTADALQSCVNTFVSKWTNTVRMFPAPVSVYGVEIADMPEPLRTYWSDAYNNLKLKCNVRPRFQPRKFTGSKKPAEALND